MRVYRLCRDKYAHLLNGKGASQNNNRWNSRGTEIIYTAESRALALAEVAVHLSLAALPNSFSMIEIEVPDDKKCIRTVDMKELETGWNSFPHLMQTARIGDAFIYQSDFLLLKVPSAVVQGDYNILINPHHKKFNTIRIEKVAKFPIDERLYKSTP